AVSTVRAAPSISASDFPFSGKRSRRRQVSDNVVICSAYSMVTPELGESKGTLPWLILEGASAPFVSDSATFHDLSGAIDTWTAFRISNGSRRTPRARWLSWTSAPIPTISETIARSNLGPKPPFGPVESHIPNPSALGQSLYKGVAFVRLTVFRGLPMDDSR